MPLLTPNSTTETIEERKSKYNARARVRYATDKAFRDKKKSYSNIYRKSNLEHYAQYHRDRRLELFMNPEEYAKDKEKKKERKRKRRWIAPEDRK